MTRLGWSIKMRAINTALLLLACFGQALLLLGSEFVGAVQCPSFKHWLDTNHWIFFYYFIQFYLLKLKEARLKIIVGRGWTQIQNKIYGQNKRNFNFLRGQWEKIKRINLGFVCLLESSFFLKSELFFDVW
jgi:hypothetical protein